MDSSASGGGARHCEALQGMALEFASKLVALYLPALEGELLESADQAKNSEQQWRLLALVREVKAHRDSIAGQFNDYLIDGFTLFRQQQLGGKHLPGEDLSTDLSLVANDELEQELAATAIARRAMARYSEVMRALDQRMAVINGGQKLPEDGNPIGPYQFANALRTALHDIKVEGYMPMQVYRLFEKRLLGNLGAFYSAANEYLIQEGVLPNLRQAKVRGAISTRPSRTPPAPSEPVPPSPVPATPAAASATTPAVAGAPVTIAQPVPAGAESANPQAVEAGLYQAIRQMQLTGQPAVSGHLLFPEAVPASGQHGGMTVSPAPQGSAPAPQSGSGGSFVPGYFSSPAFGTATPAPVPSQVCTPVELTQAVQAVTTSEFVETLAEEDVPPAMTVAHFQAATARVQQHLGEDKRLRDDDGRAIDLVGMIFEYMLGDRHLPDAVKAVLSYLHTPYLKTALLDPLLFESPEHPARLLLNTLAEAGSRWVDVNGESQFRVFSRIKDIVRRILKDPRHEVDLYEDLLAEAREFNQSVERSVSLMERRAREKAQGEERLRDAKRKALMEVRKRMAGMELPSYCVVLLLHPWLDYLTFTLLRFGPESEEWQRGLQAVDNVLWGIRPKFDKEDRDRLRILQETLPGVLAEGMQTVTFDPTRAANLLAHLRQSHELALQSQASEPAPSGEREAMEQALHATLGGHDPDPEQWTADERALVEQLQHMEYGTWLEFDELAGRQNVRTRVAWFNAQTLRYMLVNPDGKQIAVKSGLDIARMMIGGTARILLGTKKSFFERALESVLARLRGSQAQAAH